MITDKRQHGPQLMRLFIKKVIFCPKAVQKGDAWDSVSKKLSTDKRQHGPQLMRPFLNWVN
jgi:hypothetical protein